MPVPLDAKDPLQPLPKRLKRILEKHQRGCVTEQACLECASPCCSHGGFAILENVLLIYRRYVQGCITRDDYEFLAGMSFTRFVDTYFDVYFHSTGKAFWRKGLATFHMRSLSSTGDLIRIPHLGVSYYMVRERLFSANRWLNRGCVFLSRKVPEWPEDDGDASRHCILHSPHTGTHVTEKPIDCVLHTCVERGRMKTPTRRTSERWRRALAVCYPDSIGRFLNRVEQHGQKDAHVPETSSGTA